ncbi:MAG: NADH-quinone oxidoreductase subunit F, partial [Alphaproteobacteria bacterium]
MSLDLPFFTKQRKIVLRLLGHSDPENLGEYVANGGYQGLMKALTMKPEEVLDMITKSGLRGRGGGGFPTGRKWSMLAASPLVDGEKFMVCNGDEGDPGA